MYLKKTIDNRNNQINVLERDTEEKIEIIIQTEAKQRQIKNSSEFPVIICTRMLNISKLF